MLKIYKLVVKVMELDDVKRIPNFGQWSQSVSQSGWKQSKSFLNAILCILTIIIYDIHYF